MTNNQTITLPQGEFAAYQKAIESTKDRIALLVRERDEARERERIATDTYDGQQQSYRELETLYQASQERALRAEAAMTESDSWRAVAEQLHQRSHEAFVLLGQMDYFLETYRSQPDRIQRQQAAKLRAELKQLVGLK